MVPDWNGRTVVCLASGPSLIPEDIEAVRGLTTVVTNTTFRAVPWADALFGFDAPWWNLYIDEVRKVFAGRKFCQSTSIIRKDIECARAFPGFRSFGNSGANAIALAVCAGARRVVMLGYDGGLRPGVPAHHHGDHPKPLSNCHSAPRWSAQFENLSRHAKKRGTEVINVSRETNLTCFPRQSLESAL